MLIVISFINIQIIAQVTGEKVLALFSDEYGSQWIGTDMCLIRKNGKRLTAYVYPGKQLRVNDIKKANKNSLWLATSVGAFSFEYDRDNIFNIDIFDSVRTAFHTNNIVSVTFDNSKTGFFATLKGIGIYSPQGWKFYTRLVDITRNEYTSSGIKNDTIYIGTRGEGVARIFRKADVFSGASSYVRPWSSLPNDTINCVLIDSKGNQWYGTNNGICRHYNSEAKEAWDLSYNKQLSVRKINAMTQDTKGNIWIGTMGGLAEIENDSKVLKRWTHSDGLISDSVNVVFADKDASVWIGTNKGISHFKGSRFSNFRISDYRKNISYKILQENK
jgi:ligand-binding sensor domain-containing protein